MPIIKFIIAKYFPFNGKYFANHSFSGFDGILRIRFVLLYTGSTVLVRSGYSFISVEVKV